MAMLMKTYSGNEICLENPNANSIELVDIAWGLAGERRFGNQSPVFVSVAQHSVLVGAIAAHLFELDAASDRVAAYFSGWLAGLLHDAHEAYIGDMTRPFKHAVESLSTQAGHTLRRISGRLDAAIFAKFGMDMDIMAAPLLKQADDMALCLEAEHWCHWDISDWKEAQDCNVPWLKNYMRQAPLASTDACRHYAQCFSAVRRRDRVALQTLIRNYE